MRTVKWNPFLSGVVTLLGGVLLWAGAACADISSTNPAAIVVFPKLVVNTSDTSIKVDTVIQLTNTASHAVNVRCFYADANGHCSNAPTTVCDPGGLLGADCSPGYCVPPSGVTERDFAFRLTANQPVVWTVSAGLPVLPLTDTPGVGGEFNSGSIPPAIEDPMLGELKCVEVGDDELPVDSNDLKGEATIERLGSSPVEIDIQGYNAIGIQAIPPHCSQDATIPCSADSDCQPPQTADTGTCVPVNNRDNTLVIGGANAEYNGCPYQLILDHFFDDAPVVDGYVRSALTLVPCSEDFFTQSCVTTVVQFLVYNEFEQRFSTSRSVTCFSELYLSDIDTRVGNLNPLGNDNASIFNVNVEGTLTGQTTIRGVADSNTTYGHGLLGVVHEFHESEGSSGPIYSAAYMLDMRGSRTQSDVVQMPQASPAQ